jgi:hypothetical protein
VTGKTLKSPPFILALALIVVVGFFVMRSGSTEAVVTTGEEVSNVHADHGSPNDPYVEVPLDIDMEVQNVIENQGGAQENGGLVEVLLSVTPRLDATNLSWHLEMPAGMKSYSGPASWSGTVAKDQTASFVLTVSVPDGKAYYLDAVGEYATATGGQVRKARSLRIDLGEAEPPANPSSIRVDETGRRAVTFKGNVIEGGQ